MMCELFSSIICDLLVAWRTSEGAAKPLDVDEDALGLRILGLTMLLCVWLMCRQSSGSTGRPLPQEMGMQPGVPLDPRGAGSAWPPAPQPPALPVWLCPVDPNACLSPWPLASGHGGPLQWSSGLQVLQCWGFLGNSVRSPTKKIWERSGCGETPGPFLPLLPVSRCPGPGHSLDSQVGSHSPRAGELTVFQRSAKAFPSAGKPDHAAPC